MVRAMRSSLNLRLILLSGVQEVVLRQLLRDGRPPLPYIPMPEILVKSSQDSPESTPVMLIEVSILLLQERRGRRDGAPGLWK